MMGSANRADSIELVTFQELKIVCTRVDLRNFRTYGAMGGHTKNDSVRQQVCRNSQLSCSRLRERLFLGCPGCSCGRGGLA